MAENNVRDDAGDNSREPVFNISPLARGSPDKFAVNSVIMHDLALMLSEKEGGMIYFVNESNEPSSYAPFYYVSESGTMGFFGKPSEKSEDFSDEHYHKGMVILNKPIYKLKREKGLIVELPRVKAYTLADVVEGIPKEEAITAFGNFNIREAVKRYNAIVRLRGRC